MEFSAKVCVLKICAFSCTSVANRQSFLCAYFFLQRLYVLIFEQQVLYVLIGHVHIKMSVFMCFNFRT